MNTNIISTCYIEVMETKYTKKNGDVKYYATYQSAWNACIRLNEKVIDGTWLFEADTIGWFLYFEPDTI